MFPIYPVHDLLNQPETLLGTLISKAQALAKINRSLPDILDPNLISHCRIGYYGNGVLTFFAESAAWATRLRYNVPTILSTLRTIPEWAGLCSIQVKVQPHWQLPSELPFHIEEPKVRQRLSALNIQQLQILADTLKEKEDLGIQELVLSLQRLARYNDNDIEKVHA